MSEVEQGRYLEIAARLCAERAEVGQGRMMSSPGLNYRGKYFAFVHGSAMVFRLGKEVEPASLGLTSAQPLNPYKTKAPVPGWFVVDATENDRWDELTEQALTRLEADLAGKGGKGGQ